MEWSSILLGCGLSPKKVRSIVLRVSKFFVSAAHDRVWKPWCEAQVACEQSLMITQSVKTGGRVHLNRPICQVCSKPQITYISHVLAGICAVCQVSLAIHSVRGCPSFFSRLMFLQIAFFSCTISHCLHYLLYIIPVLQSEPWTALVETLGSTSSPVCLPGRSWLHGASPCG